MVVKFVSEICFGDLVDCIGIEEDVKVLFYVSLIVDNCLGKECFDF